MKTKNIKYLYIAVAILFTTVSCTDEFLEVQPKGTALEETYYKDADEAFSALVAVYDVMGFNSSSWDNMISFMNAGSDDNYGASV